MIKAFTREEAQMWCAGLSDANDFDDLPQRILALCDRVEELERALSALTDACDDMTVQLLRSHGALVTEAFASACIAARALLDKPPETKREPAEAYDFKAVRREAHRRYEEETNREPSAPAEAKARKHLGTLAFDDDRYCDGSYCWCQR